MKVFFFESPNELNSIFGEPDYNIPFLGTTLLKFNAMNILRNEDIIGEPVQIYVPENWGVESEVFRSYTNILEELQKRKSGTYELIVLTSVFSVMASDFDREHIATLKQNPDTLYQNNGVIFGYIESDTLPEPQDSEELFDNFIVTSATNFLNLNSSLIGQVNMKSVAHNGRVFGNPVVLTENITDSTICGPCFIGKGVFIGNSYIGPGTIITGESSVINSKLFSSFVDTSDISKTEAEDVIFSGSKVQGLNISNSILPLGSTVKNERKV